jgi:hypothetical protein
MAVLHFFQHTVQFSPEPLVDTESEDLRDLVGQHAQQSDITRPLKQLVNREVTAEDQIAAVFNLLDGVVAAEIDRLPVLAGEFRPDQPCPVVQPFADDVGGEPVSSSLQRLRVIDGQERIVILGGSRCSCG